MPLLLGRVRGDSAAGPGARAPSFPRKRVGGAPGAFEQQIRKNRTRFYMNGHKRQRRTTETDNVIFLRKLRTTEFLRNSYVRNYYVGPTLLRLRQRLRQRWKSGII